MKVYILDLGWLEGDVNWMATLAAYGTKAQKEVSAKWEKFPVYGVLFDTGREKILYDTGMNPEDYDRSKRFPYYCHEEQRLENQLGRIGVRPEDIHTVVLSHLHDDHCGNLPLFSHAKIYVSKDEYEYVKTEREAGRTPVGAYKRAVLHGMDYCLVEGEFQLTEELRVLSLPGHSHGLLGIEAHLEKDGVKIFVMDASNSSRNYGPPVVEAAGLYDNRQYRESIEKIRKLEKKYHGKVVFGHDMEQFQRMKHVPEYYE